MQIRHVIPLIVDLLHNIAFFWVILSSLGEARNKQSVARSSTEANYRALAATTAELIWFRWLLDDLGVDCSTTTYLVQSVSS